MKNNNTYAKFSEKITVLIALIRKYAYLMFLLLTLDVSKSLDSGSLYAINPFMAEAVM